MSENTQILSCVLIPVADRQLLLPNVAVAEIVDYVTPQPAPAGSPEWLVGHLQWRSLNLPLISYDAANGGQPLTPDNNRGRIAVLNAIGEKRGQVPFVAIVTQGIPRLVKVEEALVQEIERDMGPADRMSVELEGQELFIPNLEYLESLAAELAA